MNVLMTSATVFACPALADGDGLDLLGYVEFQRNYRYGVSVQQLTTFTRPLTTALHAVDHGSYCSL